MQYLEQTGRKVLIFAPDIAPKKVNRSRVIPLSSVGLPFAPETRVALPNFSLGRYLDDFQPDIIHLFSPAVMSMNAVLAGGKHNIPIVVNYQTDLPGYAKQHYGFTFIAPILKRWIRFIHNRSHTTLVPSNYTRIQNHSDGYRRMKIWKRGVDLERFNSNNKKLEWLDHLLNGRDPNSLLCIYVGRLAPEKRIDLLIEVAKTPGVALTVIDDGAFRNDLEATFSFHVMSQDQVCAVIDKYVVDYIVAYQSWGLAGESIYQNDTFGVLPADNLTCSTSLPIFYHPKMIRLHHPL